MASIHPYIPQTFHLGYLLYVRTLRGAEAPLLRREREFIRRGIGVKLVPPASMNFLELARF